MPTLDFKGKQIVYAHHLTVPSRTLEADAEKSLPSKDHHQPSLDDNLIIHGDNLHALKALMPRYAGRVHCISIYTVRFTERIYVLHMFQKKAKQGIKTPK